MSKRVLFFPGQASQYVGMAKDLYERSADVRQMYQMASDEMKVDIARLSFEGPADELTRTRHTQPAILLHSLSVLKIMGEALPSFDYAAGHSLGEYGALAATGALSFEDAIKAVIKRAELMEEACQANAGTMAAIIGLDIAKVEEICEAASEHGVVVPANFNSGPQLVISGSGPAVHKAAEMAREAGAKRAIVLEVGGAFHSPLMDPAKQGLAEHLASVDIATPRVPVVANVTAQPVTDGANIRTLLVEQLTSPVKWLQTMTFLKDEGVSEVVEIGPGKVLTGLAKREMRPEKSVNLDTLEDVLSFAPVLA